jgi:hypothetical protein
LVVRRSKYIRVVVGLLKIHLYILLWQRYPFCFLS